MKLRCAILILSICLFAFFFPTCTHVYEKWETTTEPTCVTNGISSSTCSLCGATSTKEIKALGHQDSEWEIICNPTCTKNGVEQIACKTCGEILESETLDALGHVNGEWITISNPTCTENGVNRILCTRCNTTLEESYQPKLEHSFVDHFCTRCGNRDTDYFDSLPFVNNPKGYALQITNTTVLSGGLYNLSYGVMGYRVRCVQRYLGETQLKL